MLSGGSASPAWGALGVDQCFAQYTQMSLEEQGAYIVNPEQGMVTQGVMANIDACAAACNASCQFFTFVYADATRSSSSGTCYIRTAPSSGTLAAKKLYFQTMPLQDMAAQSTVAGGWYTKWTTMVGEAELGVDIVTTTSASTLKSCLAACDMDSSCIIAYYDGTDGNNNCKLKTGAPGLRIRTAIHGVAVKLVQAQAADGAVCSADGDCESDRCSAGTCTPSHCFNGIKDADEALVDCGGAECATCPSKYVAPNRSKYVAAKGLGTNVCKGIRGCKWSCRAPESA